MAAGSQRHFVLIPCGFSMPFHFKFMDVLAINLQGHFRVFVTCLRRCRMDPDFVLAVS